jgi:hypothetical protein
MLLPRQRRLAAAPLLALALLGAWVREGCASPLRFRRGDPLPVMKRSQYRGERSSWREVPHDACPRFERPGVISLEALPADYLSEDTRAPPVYKMAFSFLNEQFQTPWITIADGAGGYLTHLIFYIEHAGEQVTDVRWELLYDTMSQPPPNVHLEYQFADAAEEDPRTALTALFVGGLILAVCSVLIALSESDVAFALLDGRPASAGSQRKREYDEA